MKPETALALLKDTRAQILQPDMQTPKDQKPPAATPQGKPRPVKPNVTEVATPVMA